MADRINANTEIYDKAVDRAAMVRLYERRVNGKADTILDSHIVRVDDIVKGSSNSVKGREDLFFELGREHAKAYQELHSTSGSSLLDLYTDQSNYTHSTLSETFGSIWKVEKPSIRLAENVVLERPLYNDQTLAQGWGTIGINARKRIESVIRKGIAEGDSINDIAKAVRTGAAHRITRTQAHGLVVTAVTSVTAQADFAIYEANGKAIQGWQYVAVLDSRTTYVCRMRDGKIFTLAQKGMLPPAHYHCRSKTVPVFKKWEDIADNEGLSRVRQRNLRNLTDEQKAFYDGETPLREPYSDWLMRQPKDVQLRHLGDYKKVELFNQGQLEVDRFMNPEGNTVGIKELRAMTNPTAEGDTMKFAAAKKRLDAMNLGISSPDDLLGDKQLQKTLKDYYLLQDGELDGTLSLTNYRGNLIHTKKATKNRVLMSPPTEDQVKFNPITGRYDDVRIFQPNPSVLANNLRLVSESTELLDRDKEFISGFISDLDGSMGINQRAVVTDNLRILFTRYRKNPEVWSNFKAVAQSQMKFDVMNTSDFMETQLRRDMNVLKKLLDSNYIDPVLGPVQLNDLHDNFTKNIIAKNLWEDRTAPKIAKELKSVFDLTIAEVHPTIWSRLSDREFQQFYLKFAQRLALADTPDKDQLAVQLGRDLFNLANYNGSRREWYELGNSILESKRVHKFYELETFGVQKRRMKSRMGGKYFGPYYDTLSYNIRVTDPRIQNYAKLTRKVELGMRVAVTRDENRLLVREGYKTYFIDRGVLGYEDTRIPITSTTSFGDFPVDIVDADMVKALNWAGKTQYRIDEDYYDFTRKLLYFEDDRGAAQYYNELNEYRKYITARSDSYERFKTMEWLRNSGKAFSNHPFVDHRARIYDRGLISPQSGETFRPFLNTAVSKNFSPEHFANFNDQVGSFLGGISDTLEGRFNSLTFPGRQKIAEKWRPELVKLGNHMLRGKPADMRAILESKLAAEMDGEELGKFYRLAMETAKIDNFLGGDYSAKNLLKLNDYKTALALEQDASSSGAQIIALTTRNKQLAELSNVIPTMQKKRLYDEIAAATFNDPRFKELNKKLGLTEKDLRKAAKAQNMVSFYGAGERTGILNVEGKLAKVLAKDTNTLVVKAAERDSVLNEISAKIARYEKFDLETAKELRQLRNDVKDIFNKGLDPGDDIMEQLYFLDTPTRDLVGKMTMQYDRVVTPDDFKGIAKIMSEHLAAEVPILKDFTRFFGRLAEDFLINARPRESDFDWVQIAKSELLGTEKSGYKLSPTVSRILGIKANESLSEKALKRFGAWVPNGNLKDVLYGVKAPEDRRIGGKFFKVEVFVPDLTQLQKGVLLKEQKLSGIELFTANKLPKRWTNVPWVNFDGKTIEQNFTQTFEERLNYKNAEGKWITNVLQIPQKTSTTWWEELANKSGNINDIADATKARTAFAVNGNHSNDAVLVKRFHIWGSDNNIPTSTIHDAFFTNAADMLKARHALRGVYAKALESNNIIKTLDEMHARGLPDELYEKYLNEAIDIGLIPIAGRSKIGGRIMKESDILTRDDVLKEIPLGFKNTYGWYGVN